MKEAIALLLTKIAEWMGYPQKQLKELYAPLDLLIRDSVSLLELYPEVLIAPEVAGKRSEYQLKKARDQAEQIMDQVHGLMAPPIKSATEHSDFRWKRANTLYVYSAAENTGFPATRTGSEWLRRTGHMLRILSNEP